jgi:excisionase family DNA binding protein
MAELVKAAALADHLAIHRSTVYRLADRGQLPVRLYVGKSPRFDLDQVEQWLETKSTPAPAATEPYRPAPVATSKRPAPQRRGRVSIAHLLD